MLEFDVQRCSRRCAATGRDLQPGEQYVSVLVPDGGQVQRLDYSAEAWAGPPENAIGWWRSKIPEPNANRLQWAPNDVLLSYFEQLTGDPAKLDERYVLALLLVRRRILRLEETRSEGPGQDLLIVSCPRNETEYQVLAQLPDDERVRQIQEGLGRLLSVGGLAAFDSTTPPDAGEHAPEHGEDGADTSELSRP